VASVIKQGFPIIEQKKAVQLRAAITVGAKKQQPAALKEEFQWFFYSKDRQKCVHIAAEAFYVEYKSYDSFKQLRKEFTGIAESLFIEFPELQVSRFGLRYVNNIQLDEDDPTDWSAYLQPKVLHILKIASDPKTITRALQLLDFDYGDMQMRFQGGIPNPDHPAPIRRKHFLLDYDAFCSGLLSISDIQTNLEKFHDKIKRSFEEVITDRLRKKMNSNA
jgi:uncharacterized protein (TIGR04255 family)